MNNRDALKTLQHIILIAFFAVLAMSSAFYNGLPSGNDLPQHFQFASTVRDSIIGGEFYPSFSATTNQGYGDVGLRFYPPFSYYVLVFFVLIAGNWYLASLFTFTVIFFIGGLGVYFWTKEEFPATQSLIAATVYILAPYHLNQIYNGFLFAEFVASAIVPFCFLFLSRICRAGKFKDVLGLSIFYTLLILTNLPSAIISSIILSIYALSFLERKTIFKTLFKSVISVAIAVAASSFYWIRMVTELSWVNVSAANNFTGIYDYRENFLFVPQNIYSFATDNSFLWLGDLMLLVILLISIPSMVTLLKQKKKLTRFTKAITVVFFTGVFFTTQLSRFIWDNFLLLQKVQFPWRWLGVISLCGAVFSSIGIVHAAAIMKQSKSLLVPIGIGIVFLLFTIVSVFITKGAVFLSAEELNGQVAEINSAKSFDCWWTVWAKSEALQMDEKVIASGRSYKILNWKPLERHITVEVGKPTSVRFATFYYPRWQAIVNGENVAIEIANDGTILIPIPADESNVQLVFREPYFIKITSYVSFVVWLFLAFGIIFFLLYENFSRLHLPKRRNNWI